MTEKVHENSDFQDDIAEPVIFSAQSMEDVAFRFDAFSESQKQETCLCFDIRVDGLLDTESVIEASRWLCSHSAIFVPSLPLEPSALFLVEKMKPRAISLHLVYDALGDKELKLGFLKVILEKLELPIWIARRGLTEEQISQIQDLPIERFWDGV